VKSQNSFEALAEEDDFEDKQVEEIIQKAPEQDDMKESKRQRVNQGNVHGSGAELRYHEKSSGSADPARYEEMNVEAVVAAEANIETTKGDKKANIETIKGGKAGAKTKKKRKRVWSKFPTMIQHADNLESKISINAVEKGPKWVSTGVGEIAVYSAAEESVCPRDWGKQYPVRQPNVAQLHQCQRRAYEALR
jgi:hypothetical protein